ncbi:Ig-like domain-containing protein, partial [Mycolicibacterium sp. P9-22]|uniref:Ig-like domain-containing protein n=1 Tax=Mycolicibacterium sp. P9-22 TaxID=2024613 RepID=UPI001257371B
AAPALPPQASIEITKATPTPPSLARPIRQAVLGVLGIFGFNPNPGSTNNPLLEALWGTYRRIESFLDNQPATARTTTITTSELIDDTVAITGTVTFEDPNNDPLRYTTTQGAHGTVTINPNGTFTYTPTDPHFTGTDTFTITANDDKNFHLHGPLAFLRPDWGHTSSATLTITLDKAGNVAPVITNHTGPTTSTDGKTTGIFTVTDLNGDPITLNLSQTTKGTVTYAITPDATTPGAHTVTYTYTPTFAARLAASYAGADTTETITITATDGTTTSNPLSITAT